MALDERQKKLWLRELELNGFVVLRRFLPLELVRAMREELEPLLDAEYAKAKADDFKQGRNRGRLSLHIGEYADLLRGALADERYRRNPIVEELLDAVMGPGRWTRGWTVVEAVWDEADFMAWHSDQKVEDTPDMDAPHETIRMTFNIPLVDFTWQSGATEYIPGSHRLPRRFHTEGLAGIPTIHSTRIDLWLGDALLRDGNVLHRGTPNLSGEVRPMLDQTYKKTSGR